MGAAAERPAKARPGSRARLEGAGAEGAPAAAAERPGRERSRARPPPASRAGYPPGTGATERSAFRRLNRAVRALYATGPGGPRPDVAPRYWEAVCHMWRSREGRREIHRLLQAGQRLPVEVCPSAYEEEGDAAEAAAAEAADAAAEAAGGPDPDAYYWGDWGGAEDEAAEPTEEEPAAEAEAAAAPPPGRARLVPAAARGARPEGPARGRSAMEVDSPSTLPLPPFPHRYASASAERRGFASAPAGGPALPRPRPRAALPPRPIPPPYAPEGLLARSRAEWDARGPGAGLLGAAKGAGRGPSTYPSAGGITAFEHWRAWTVRRPLVDYAAVPAETHAAESGRGRRWYPDSSQWGSHIVVFRHCPAGSGH